MNTFYFIFIGLSFSPLVSSCVSSGVCGNYCYQPPQSSCQPASCQPGYMCGPYGCAKAKARSSLTKKDGLIVNDEANNKTIANNIFGLTREHVFNNEKLNYTMFAQLTNPNYHFRKCCENRQLPDSCLNKCHFNSYTKSALQEMFFKNDPCPLEAAADIQYCAAQGKDHRTCCENAGVGETIAGEKCLIFCDQRPGQIKKLSLDYVPCYDKFESIKRCFYDKIKAVAIEKFTPQLEDPRYAGQNF